MRSVFTRSARIASSTPGYCTLTATSHAVARHGPVHLTDRRRRDRHRVPLPRTHARARRRARRARPTRDSSGDIGGASCCSAGERVAHRFGQAVVEIARHLSELHQRALQLAERAGDVGRGAQLVRGFELGALFHRCGREPRPVHRVTGARTGAHQRESCVARRDGPLYEPAAAAGRIAAGRDGDTGRRGRRDPEHRSRRARGDAIRRSVDLTARSSFDRPVKFQQERRCPPPSPTNSASPNCATSCSREHDPKSTPPAEFARRAVRPRSRVGALPRRLRRPRALAQAAEHHQREAVRRGRARCRTAATRSATACARRRS